MAKKLVKKDNKIEDSKNEIEEAKEEPRKSSPGLEKMKELNRLAHILNERKKTFGIVDTRLDIPEQKQLFDYFLNTKDRPKWYLYYGGNGSGKTFIGAYLTVCLALGRDGKKYGLPFLGEKRNIWIVTKSGANVQSTIEPYLLGDFSKTRIPPDEISGVPHRDNKILKGIRLKNGCYIKIQTYDQEAEGLQGANPDFVWLDEEPRKESVWEELLMRTRGKGCEMVVSMTPLSGKTPIYDFFFKEGDEDNLSKKVIKVSAKNNPHTDHRLFEGMSNEQYLRRVEGTFAPPSGLVYNEFSRDFNVIDEFDPLLLGDEAKFYRSIDLGVSHPTGVIFATVDGDGNIFVFDEIYRKNTLLGDIYREIIMKSKDYDFEYTVRDSAAKREGIELKNLGLHTIPADKHSKGENEMSNRRAGIMKINQMLFNRKLFISSRCKNLIYEFENHFYKEGGRRDGEVEKINDDLLDALRYFIFSYNKPKAKTSLQKKYEQKHKESFLKEIYNLKSHI